MLCQCAEVMQVAPPTGWSAPGASWREYLVPFSLIQFTRVLSNEIRRGLAHPYWRLRDAGIHPVQQSTYPCCSKSRKAEHRRSTWLALGHRPGRTTTLQRARPSASCTADMQAYRLSKSSSLNSNCHPFGTGRFELLSQGII